MVIKGVNIFNAGRDILTFDCARAGAPTMRVRAAVETPLGAASRGRGSTGL